MKQLIFVLTLFAVSINWGQSNTSNWEKTVYLVKHQGQKVHKTTIEFIDQALTMDQMQQISSGLNSKEEIIDVVFEEGKTLIVYHSQSIDDSGIKTFVEPITAQFFVREEQKLTLEQVENIYKQNQSLE